MKLLAPSLALLVATTAALPQVSTTDIAVAPQDTPALEGCPGQEKYDECVELNKDTSCYAADKCAQYCSGQCSA